MKFSEKTNLGVNDKKIIDGAMTAFADCNYNSEAEYKPQFISNDYKQGKKVLAAIEDELKKCDYFCISVAFITESGVAPLKQVLKELEENGVPGRILTTDYLNFSSPDALEELNSLKNIELRVYKSALHEGFHTKGYLFKKEETWRIITGSSNLTASALTKNKEWNTKVVSTERGEYMKDVLAEFRYLWDRGEPIDDWIDTYRKIYEHQKRTVASAYVLDIEDYTLKPNDMQVSFINNLKKLVNDGERKALLISATGTGKTYASAFALRELGIKRALFVVHRGQLAVQAMESYRHIFAETKSMGLLTGESHDFDADIIFATVQTLYKDETLKRFSRDCFDVIVIDEVHRAGASGHQKIIDYFNPVKLLLGMSASPERTDGYDIYSIFDHNIAQEIRLQQAMERDLLCPFHYFGISDVEVNGRVLEDDEDFNNLILDERVSHIIEKIKYYGYSGDRVKGLIFCSRKDEAKALSEKFNNRGYRTLSLSGEDSQEKRLDSIERLVGEDNERALDYIFTVDIFNEGVDIPEINQIVMLRPTVSPVVFVQQLGRGLRKAVNKEFVIIIDFIGNYNKNFMIPMALSGDRTYNKDNIRKYVREGTRVIPGASSVHFDQISRRRIFDKIDEMKIGRRQLKENYNNLKFKLGTRPSIMDFYNHGEIDPMLIIEEFKTYYDFLKYCDAEYDVKITDEMRETLEFVSCNVADGKRMHELVIINMLMSGISVTGEAFKSRMESECETYDEIGYLSAIRLLNKDFLVMTERKKFENVCLMKQFDEKYIASEEFVRMLNDSYFICLLEDIIELGLARYNDKYKMHDANNMVLYEKYSRKDVCRILNWEKDEHSTIYGYRIKHGTCPIFVTYNKVDGIAKSTEYPDHFIDEGTFMWATRNRVTLEHQEVISINAHKEKNILLPLFLKKSDGEGTDFYYMGTVTPRRCEESTIKNDKGKELPIVYFYFDMDSHVRDDVYEYFVEGAC